jgi:hypothetical protein
MFAKKEGLPENGARLYESPHSILVYGLPHGPIKVVGVTAKFGT